MLQAIYDGLAQVAGWLEHPAAKTLQSLFVIFAAGGSTYSAIVINQLKNQVKQLENQIQNLDDEHANLLVASVFRAVIADIPNKSLHKAPEIPKALTNLARGLPTFSQEDDLFAVFDRRMAIFDRSSIAAFTNRGIHWTGGVHVDWDTFLEKPLEVTKEHIAIGSRKIDMNGDDPDSVKQLFDRLRTDLRNSLGMLS